MKVGLTAGDLQSDNFSIVPQAMVALAFNRESINSFFNGSLTDSSDDFFVFSKGDTGFIEFSHEYGAGTSGKSSLKFRLKILDENNTFLNALFGQRFEDYMKRAKEALPEAREEAGESISESSVSDSFLQRNPGYFDLELLSKLEQKLNIRNNFYLTYGTGPSNKYWAGPFVCTLSKGIYKEDSEGATLLELEFVGSSSEKDIKSNKVDTATTTYSFNDSIPFFKVTTTATLGEMWAFSDTLRTDLQISFLYDSTQKAVEDLVVTYLKGLGIKNVLLCFRDIPRAFEDIVIDTPDTIARGESVDYVLSNRPTDSSYFIQGSNPVLEFGRLQNYFNILGISFTMNNSDNTRLYSLGEDVNNLTRTSISYQENTRSDMPELSLYPGNNINNPLVDTSQEKIVEEWSLALDTSKVEETGETIAPVMSLLKSLQSSSSKLLDPVFRFENNAETVNKLHEVYPEYVTDPGESVLIIGENFLIQSVLYGKEINVDTAEYMQGTDGSIVSTVESRKGDMKGFFNDRKVRKPYISIFDERAQLVPDEFALAQSVVDNIRKYNIPTFRVGTTNPNVTRMTVTSDGFLISTISETCRQIAQYVAQQVSDTYNQQLLSPDNESTLRNSIERILSSFHEENFINNVEEVIDAGNPDFANIASEVTQLIINSPSLRSHPITTKNTSASLVAYLYNFYRLFSFSHKAILKTLPQFNFSETDLLGDNCILFKDINKTLLGDTSITRSIYTGVWTILGFKHVISSNDAYSEFSVVKKPFSLESNT
jgi:hypothetical protein